MRCRARRTHRAQQLHQPEQHAFDQQLRSDQPADAPQSDADVEQPAATVRPFIISGSGFCSRFQFRLIAQPRTPAADDRIQRTVSVQHLPVNQSGCSATRKIGR